MYRLSRSVSDPAGTCIDCSQTAHGYFFARANRSFYRLVDARAASRSTLYGEFGSGRNKPDPKQWSGSRTSDSAPASTRDSALRTGWIESLARNTSDGRGLARNGTSSAPGRNQIILLNNNAPKSALAIFCSRNEKGCACKCEVVN